MNISTVPIIRVAFENKFVVWTIFFEPIRSASHDIFGTRPFLTVFFDRLPRNQTEKLMSEQSQKIWSALPQRDSQRVVVDRLDADVLGLDRNKFTAFDGRLQFGVSVELLGLT